MTTHIGYVIHHIYLRNFFVTLSHLHTLFHLLSINRTQVLQFRSQFRQEITVAFRNRLSMLLLSSRWIMKVFTIH